MIKFIIKTSKQTTKCNIRMYMWFYHRMKLHVFINWDFNMFFTLVTFKIRTSSYSYSKMQHQKLLENNSASPTHCS